MTDQVLWETGVTGFLLGMCGLLTLSVIWSCVKTYFSPPKKRVYDWKRNGDF